MLGLMMLAASMTFVACTTKDDPVVVVPEDDPEVIIQPVYDVIETYLDGDIAVVGNHFDEVTTYILSRVKGQVININLYEPIPESVKYLLLDDQTVQNITADDIDYFIIPAYRQGVTICMHKPSDWKASGILMGLWQVEWGTEDETDDDQAAGIRKTRTSDDGTSDTGSSYDFWAMKPGGKTFQLTDIYVPDKVYTDTVHIIEHQENGDVERDSTYTVTSEEPTPYQYGLFAEQAVKWLNETPAEAQARATRAGITGEGTADNPYTVVTNASAGHYSKRVTSPLKLSVWALTLYNFERDEDFYSVVVQEEFDAGKIYKGETWCEDEWWGGSGWAGLTWLNFGIRTCWPHDDYTVRSQSDILPQGKANPVRKEEISGWTATAEVSLGLTGVTAKPLGSLKNEKKITTVIDDVTLTNSKDGKWMGWRYDFDSQVAYKGNLGKPDLVALPTNATSRSLSTQNQAWRWVIGNTKQRGTVPFHFNLNINLMEAYEAGYDLFYFVATTKHRVWMFDVDRDFTFNLPVPQRCKHVYSLTTDEISDLAEFNNLMTALRNVSTNFNSLYNKLIRLDEDGNPAGRTGMTYTALERMVGQEWYDLAHEVQGMKIKVDKTYKFYVKDETGKKLQMVANQNGEYIEKGIYLVIAPDGIKIEGSPIDYKVGESFTVLVNDQDFTYKVVKEKEEVSLVSAPRNYKGVLEIPATVNGMKVVSIGTMAIVDAEGNMTKIILPNTLRKLEYSAINNNFLEEIVIPEGVTTLCRQAVVMWKLKRVYLPSTLTELGSGAFCCGDITEVHIKATTPPFVEDPFDLKRPPFLVPAFWVATLYVPAGYTDVYRNSIWGAFSHIEPE